MEPIRAPGESSRAPTVCEVCGADDYQVLFQGRDRLHGLPGVFPVVLCRRCGLTYLNPRPSDESLGFYYPEDYSPFCSEGGIAHRLQSLLREREAAGIARKMPKHGRVLEVGCATGDLLKKLERRGLSVSGIEMSPHAAAHARERNGLEVHTGTLFDSPYPISSFDAVIMRHVIEHFPSSRRALEKVLELLKPGGTVFITTPNTDSLDCRIFRGRWHDYDPPRHLAVFSVATLSRLLRETGFEVTAVRHSLVPNDWIYSSRILLEEKLGEGRLVRFFSLRNPFLLFAFLPLGVIQKITRASGRIEVVGRKRG